MLVIYTYYDSMLIYAKKLSQNPWLKWNKICYQNQFSAACFYRFIKAITEITASFWFILVDNKNIHQKGCNIRVKKQWQRMSIDLTDQFITSKRVNIETKYIYQNCQKIASVLKYFQILTQTEISLINVFIDKSSW